MALRQTDDVALIITKGIVIAERGTVKSDRTLTLYTEELGVIDVYAHGAKGTKNSLFSALALFQYCEFGIAQRKGFYTVREAETINSFFSLSDTLEGISLALYCAELIRCINPTEEEAKTHLPLFLNTLYLISKQQNDADMIKAVFELRTMSGHGFMPTLVACSSCFEYKEQPHLFDYKSGKMLCSDCAKSTTKSCNLTAAGVAAMRHIVFSEPKAAFAFKLSDPRRCGLISETEKFTLWHLDKKPKSLEFYHKLTELPTNQRRENEQKS